MKTWFVLDQFNDVIKVFYTAWEAYDFMTDYIKAEVEEELVERCLKELTDEWWKFGYYDRNFGVLHYISCEVTTGWRVSA